MEEMNQLKMFTVEQANQLLPWLTQNLLELQQKRNEIISLEVEIDAMELISGGENEPLSDSLSEKVEEYTDTVNRFYAVVDEIQESGCLLKDVNLGLIDFYTYRNDHIVFLCWKLGESEVGYWHDVGSGYNYRQPLTSDSK